jgi:hypothetical protein
MSTHAASASAALPAASAPSGAGKALAVGIAGIVLTACGLIIPHNGQAVAFSWLVGVTFWTAIAIGMLLMTMIHHSLTPLGRSSFVASGSMPSPLSRGSSCFSCRSCSPPGFISATSSGHG